VLVTGGAGFIGAHVVKALRERYPESGLRVLHLPRERLDNLDGLDGLEFVAGDVTVREEVDAAVAGCDVVFHLAAIYALWLPDMDVMRRVNVEGTRNVLDACRRHGVRRVVHTSSAVCFCGQGLDVESDERSPFSMEGMPYAATKRASHELAERFAADGLDVVIVCPAAPIGPGDIGPTPTGRMIVEIFRLPFAVALRTLVNVIDVRDCALGHVLALERGRKGESYLLAGENFGHAEILERALALCGRKARIIELPPSTLLPLAHLLALAAQITGRAPLLTPAEIRQARGGLVCDGAKARRELGLHVRPLDESLRDAVAWFAERGRIRLRGSRREPPGAT
jgi:dihydroflavonol-4-reductase